jgi:hypothetical protein
MGLYRWVKPIELACLVQLGSQQILLVLLVLTCPGRHITQIALVLFVEVIHVNYKLAFAA